MARWQPPAEQVVETRPRRPRWPLVALLLAFAAVAAAGVYMFRQRIHPSQARYAKATGVRSTIVGRGDSLDVLVSWDFTEGATRAMADSVRVEVGLGDGSTSASRIIPNDREADTVRLGLQPGSGAVSGYSCVAAVYGAHLTRESCTPWKFLGPPQPDAARAPDSAAVQPPRTSARSAPRVTRLVIAPDGQQVDPDLGGRCAAWQRQHPHLPVWTDANGRAVPECTGPNGKPVVAQFCAFAVLGDGRRLMTTSSTGNAYCERLFDDWVHERVT